jgi:hypothetical protein
MMAAMDGLGDVTSSFILPVNHVGIFEVRWKPASRIIPFSKANVRRNFHINMDARVASVRSRLNGRAQMNA